MLQGHAVALIAALTAAIDFQLSPVNHGCHGFCQKGRAQFVACNGGSPSSAKHSNLWSYSCSDGLGVQGSLLAFDVLAPVICLQVGIVQPA